MEKTPRATSEQDIGRWQRTKAILRRREYSSLIVQRQNDCHIPWLDELMIRLKHRSSSEAPQLHSHALLNRDFIVALIILIIDPANADFIALGTAVEFKREKWIF